MNCTKCKTKAVIGLPRHNAAFCKGCFNGFVHDQVARAIKSEKMIAREDRVLVAVSGGKDSLALWDILLKLGYRADALYVDLGIGAYSQCVWVKRSGTDAVEAFVRTSMLPLAPPAVARKMASSGFVATHCHVPRELKAM